MASKNLEIVITAKDKASGTLGKIGGALGTIGKFGAGAAIAGIAGLGAGLAVAAKTGFSFNNSMEKVTAQISAFTKDASKTTQILGMIQERAAKTPFAFEEMANAAASLIPAAKVSGQELEGLVAMAEILAASNPAEGLEGAAFSLREALSGDFVSIVERFNLPRQTLKQLKEEGVPALEAVSIAMKEMGLDADLVTKLGQTASGRLSTFKDTLVGLAATATQPIFERFSKGMGFLNEWLGKNQPMLENFAKTIGKGIIEGFDNARLAIRKLVEAFQGSEQAVNFMRAKFGDIGGFLARAAQSVAKFIDSFGELKRIFTGIGEDIFDTNDAIREFLFSLGLSSGAVDAIENVLIIIEKIREEIPSAFGELTRIFSGIGEDVYDTNDAIREILTTLGLSSGAVDAIEGVLIGFERMRENVVGFVTEALPKFDTFLGRIREIGGIIGAQILMAFEKIKDIGSTVGETLVKIGEAFGITKDNLVPTVDAMTIFESILNGITSAASGFAAFLTNVNVFLQNFKTGLDNFLTTTGPIFAAFWAKMQEVWPQVLAVWAEAGSKIDVALARMQMAFDRIGESLGLTNDNLSSNIDWLTILEGVLNGIIIVIEGFSVIVYGIASAFELAASGVEALASGIESLGGLLSSVGDAWQAFSDRISSISIPDWLIPGSPTPLEMGLRGIAGVMQDINKMDGLNISPPGMQAAGAMGGSQSINIYLDGQQIAGALIRGGNPDARRKSGGMTNL